MMEVINHQTPEGQRRAEVITGFLAWLPQDRPLSMNERYAAAMDYVRGLEDGLVSSDTPLLGDTAFEDTTEVIDEVAPEPIVKDEPIETELSTKSHADVTTPTYLRDMYFDEESRRIRRKHVKFVAKALTIGVAAASSTYIIPVTYDSMTSTRYVELPLEDDIEATPPVTEKPVITVVPPSTSENTATGVSQAEIGEGQTEETERTVIPTTVPLAEAPVELSLTQRILAGETTLADNRGQLIGELVLDETCLSVKVYVNNPIPFKKASEVPADVQPYFTIEAWSILQQLDNKMSSNERHELEDELDEIPLVDGKGNPLYYMLPKTTSEVPANCIPEMPDSRTGLPVRGSAKANNSNMTADQLEATAIMYEQSTGIPGQGMTTEIAGHNRTRSAAFNNLKYYELGDTVTWIADNTRRTYRLVEIMAVNKDEPVAGVTSKQDEKRTGEKMLLQVCVDGNTKTFNTLVFELV